MVDKQPNKHQLLNSCWYAQGTGLASHRSNGSQAAAQESIALTFEECQEIRSVKPQPLSV